MLHARAVDLRNPTGDRVERAVKSNDRTLGTRLRQGSRRQPRTRRSLRICGHASPHAKTCYANQYDNAHRGAFP
jgi:hypothetical protein